VAEGRSEGLSERSALVGATLARRGERRRWLALLAWAVTVIAASVVTFLVGARMAMCAAPPSGRLLVTPVSTYVDGIVPGLVVFLISEYLALGFQRRRDRLIASLLLLPVAGIAAVAGLVFLPGACGDWLP
jgi:hypothetical protein